MREITNILREIHGERNFDLRIVDNVPSPSEAEIHGLCDFAQEPPSVVVRGDADEDAFVDILCHELAHLVCGLAAGHDEAWQNVKDELSNRFWANRLLSWNNDPSS